VTWPPALGTLIKINNVLYSYFMRPTLLPDHIALDDAIVSGSDPGCLQLWRHRKQEEDWELIRTQRNPTPQELSAGICGVPVTISRGWKEIRFSIARLLGRKETSMMTETVPRAKRNIRVERYPQAGIPALILWAKEAGITLDESAVRGCIREYKRCETLGPDKNICLVHHPEVLSDDKKGDPSSLWHTVDTVSDTISEPNTDIIASDQNVFLSDECGTLPHPMEETPTDETSGSEMQEMSKKIIAVLREHGNVVADLHYSSFTRMAVCLKYWHSVSTTIQDCNQDVQEGRNFLKHQNNIASAFAKISDITTIQKIHLFPEGLPADEQFCEYCLPTIIHSPWDEDFLKEIENIPDGSGHLYRHWCEREQEWGQEEAQSAFDDGVLGENRCIRMAVHKGLNPLTQLHGLTTLERLERIVQNKLTLKTKGIWNRMEFVENQQQNFKVTHEHLIRSLNNNISPGEVGIVILGGNHFKSGIIEHDLPDFFGMKVENYIENCRSLNNMRVIVVDVVGCYDRDR